MNTLLSIGIPTYNRSAILVQLIEAILCQITDDIRDSIEIFISDDHSPDNPAPQIEPFLKNYPGLFRFRRSESNSGFSANFDATVRYAKGKFVLLMANDDGLEENAIATILQALKTHPDVGMAYFDSREWDSMLVAPTGSFVPSPNRLYKTGLDFVREMKSYTPCLISGYVFNRDAWLSTNPEKFLTSITIQIPVAMLILAQHSLYWHHESPVIKYRAENGTWSPANDSIYPFPLLSGYLDACKAVKNLYPRALLNALYWSISRTMIGHTIRNKVLGLNFNRKVIEEFLRPSLLTDSLFTSFCTFLVRFFFRIPKFFLYVPFRWLVPQKL